MSASARPAPGPTDVRPTAAATASAPQPALPAHAAGRRPWLRWPLPDGWATDLGAFFGAMACAVLAALVVGSIGGCGGGVGFEGTGTFASVGSGPITGFGSIIVGGVRYDESSATVTDDDGSPASRDALALGMVVRVQGGAVTTAADGSTRRATASSVQTQRAIVGPVEAVNAAAGSLQVLGQTVLVTADTVLGSGLEAGLGGVAVGQLLQVWGLYDSGTQAWLATRLDPAAASSPWRLRGTVAAQAAGGTITVGTQVLSGAVSGLAVGSEALLTIRTERDGQGRLQVGSGRLAEALPEDRDGACIDGVVASVLSATRFTLGTVTVDTSLAEVKGSIAPGARVEVTGTLKANVLQATEVKATGRDEARGFELNGSPSALDTAAARFTLRGVTVSYAQAVFRNGNAQRLVGYAGTLRVTGRLSDDRRTMVASEVSFGS